MRHHSSTRSKCRPRFGPSRRRTRDARMWSTLVRRLKASPAGKRLEKTTSATTTRASNASERAGRARSACARETERSESTNAKRLMSTTRAKRKRTRGPLDVKTGSRSKRARLERVERAEDELVGGVVSLCDATRTREQDGQLIADYGNVEFPRRQLRRETRRETLDRLKRDANEAQSALLGTLCEGALWRVCSFLSAKDLASLECTSAYFRNPSRITDRGLSMAECVARERLRPIASDDMPPFYRKISWKQKLRMIEERAEPLKADELKPGMWLRVKSDAEMVKRMCTGVDKGVSGYPVGWESGMEDACGKCFRVCVVSRDYRTTPVVGLSVAQGLVAIARGKTPTYGWYFPFESLTRP